MNAAEFVEPVRRFADTILEHGRDKYGQQDIPTVRRRARGPIANGLDLRRQVRQEKLPPDWKFEDEWYPDSDERPNADAIVSNFATQGNFLRIRTGLS